MLCIINIIASVGATVGPLHGGKAVELSRMELPTVHAPVVPSEEAIPMLMAVLELALINTSIHLESPLPMPLAAEVGAHVRGRPGLSATNLRYEAGVSQAAGDVVGLRDRQALKKRRIRLQTDPLDGGSDLVGR